jgi:hypothetical protein
VKVKRVKRKNQIECDICKGTVELDHYFGEGKCIDCGQKYSYDEAIFPILTSNQLELLKQFNLANL